MKSVIGIVMLVFSLTMMAGAQTRTQKGRTPAKKSTVKTAPAKKTSAQKTAAHNVTTLSVTDAYPAKGAAAYPTGTRLQIADPTVRAFNIRANGGYAPLSSSGIIGVPKRAYGFNNGQFILRHTDATTSGTSTGSGSVGTGTSPGNLGVSGYVQGVNGKSPYAGAEIYSIPITDGRQGTDHIRTRPAKRKE